MAKTRYEVTYWHTGDDGKYREPGDHVDLDPAGDEVRRRLSDGFIRENSAKAEHPKAADAKTETK